MSANVNVCGVGPSTLVARLSRAGAFSMVLMTALALVTNASAQTCDGWRLLSESGPLARYHQGMAYDTARGVSVVFGGLDSRGNGISDTWEWDGANWALVSQDGPGPRYFHSMSYDSVRGVTVVYGGYSRLTDTWEWNGSQWNQVATTGPDAQHSHAMAFDSARGVTVLFGGAGENRRLNDTWEWDGAAWSQVAQTGPSDRTDAAMAYDSARGVMVLFGGVDGVDRGDTWEWDGVEWTLVSETGPCPRHHHTMAYDPVRGVVILYGGELNTGRADVFGDTWEWDGHEWTLVSNTEPGVRYGASMVYDAAHGAPVLFGGRYENPYGDTWGFVKGAGGFFMAPVMAACPGGGSGLISWACGSPGGRVALLFATTRGSTTMPRGPCAGTTLGLGPWPQFVRAGRSDESGRGAMIIEHAPNACGGYVQIVDLVTCATTFVDEVE